MDRDEVAIVLSIIVSGILVWLTGALVPKSITDDETRAWRRVWLPALPASFPVAVLFGWALVDPEASQAIHLSRWFFLIPIAVIWGRAGIRGCRSVLAHKTGYAHAAGLLFPRIFVSDAFRRALTPGELTAVLAHEESHVRHRDPLRMLVGQWLTDLQWPLPQAERRRRTWLHALELTRDDEAIFARGADPVDLASALVKGAQLGSAPSAGVASLVDNDVLLEVRVVRLLNGLRPTAARSHSFVPLSGLLLIAAFAFGALASNPLIVWIAGAP